MRCKKFCLRSNSFNSSSRKLTKFSKILLDAGEQLSKLLETKVGLDISEQRIEAGKKELQKEIDRHKGQSDFFGYITAQIHFKAGVAQFSRVDISRTICDSVTKD
jgi:hypothetical protein